MERPWREVEREMGGGAGTSEGGEGFYDCDDACGPSVLGGNSCEQRGWKRNGKNGRGKGNVTHDLLAPSNTQLSSKFEKRVTHGTCRGFAFLWSSMLDLRAEKE